MQGNRQQHHENAPYQAIIKRCSGHDLNWPPIDSVAGQSSRKMVSPFSPIKASPCRPALLQEKKAMPMRRIPYSPYHALLPLAEAVLLHIKPLCISIDFGVDRLAW